MFLILHVIWQSSCIQSQFLLCNITFQVSLSKFALGIVLCLEVFKLFDFAVIQSLIIIIIIIIRHYINVSFFSTLFVLIFFCSLFILISQLNSNLWPWLEIFLLSLIFRTYLEDELAKAKSKPRKVSTT